MAVSWNFTNFKKTAFDSPGPSAFTFSPAGKIHKLNLIICGEIELNNPSAVPFAVGINDPSKTTVSDLKAMTSDNTGIPREDLILHFSDSILPDDAPLSQWKDMRSGAAVLARVKPLIVTLQRYNSDIDVKFELPELEVLQWSTKTFFDFCQYKGGLPYRKNGKYLFALNGAIMKEEGKMSDYQYNWHKLDLTVSVTYIRAVTKIASTLGEFHVPYPLSSYSEQNYRLSTSGFGGQQYVSSQFRHPWYLRVQKMDGAINTIAVQQYYRTPIYQLRHQISPDTNIRLTFGTTILEDWDDEGNMMLLCSYPDLHDGATLCQINLTEAMKVKYEVVLRQGITGLELRNSGLKVNCHDFAESTGYLTMASPSVHIHVENPKHFTFMKLLKIIRNVNGYYSNSISEEVHCSGRQVQAKPDDVISSVNLIHDGCTLTGYAGGKSLGIVGIVHNPTGFGLGGRHGSFGGVSGQPTFR